MSVQSQLSVRVPGSSANLGPGFDVLGMAVSVYAVIGIDGARQPQGQPMHPVVEGRHPALVAYRRAGGARDVWVHSSIPSGRGLGFSGAMRVGAVALGLAERNGVVGGELQPFIEESRGEILDISAELEGHADNAAASLYGGIVACAATGGGFSATRVPLANSLRTRAHIVVWVPHEQTATSESRATLPSTVTRADAVFNLSRTAQIVLAFGSGDFSGLALGAEDRLHQDHRLERVPTSRRALDAMRESGAIAAWLSGSGPTVAALVESGHVDEVEAALSCGDLSEAGRTMRLEIDHAGLQAAR